MVKAFAGSSAERFLSAPVALAVETLVAAPVVGLGRKVRALAVALALVETASAVALALVEAFAAVVVAPVEAVTAVTLALAEAFAAVIVIVVVEACATAFAAELRPVELIPPFVKVVPMEGERPYVGLGVLFLLRDALLELAVLLESMLLGHLALLVVGLHHAALKTELAQLAVEQLVFAELAL